MHGWAWSQAVEVGASNTVFAVVFVAFVLAVLVLVFITLRWAVRRDRQGRRDWVARRTGRGEG